MTGHTKREKKNAATKGRELWIGFKYRSMRRNKAKQRGKNYTAKICVCARKYAFSRKITNSIKNGVLSK